jgi:hydrogenase maturation protein HypF
MPGGDRAAREPWRMAAAVLFDLHRGEEIAHRFPAQPATVTVHEMLQKKLNCATTTSMGRLFDAAAGLLKVSEIQSHEGQAAMLLEGLAESHGRVESLQAGYTLTPSPLMGEGWGEGGAVLDFRPLLVELANCKNSAYGAALFHATLAEGLSAWVQRAATQSNIKQVALGGGCFLNNVLSQVLADNLSVHGLRVLTAQQVPPNDGGIALGQAWLALQNIRRSI